jgi:hypothetical protein
MRAKPAFKVGSSSLWTGSERLHELGQNDLNELVGPRVAEGFSQARTIAFQIARGRQALVVLWRWLRRRGGAFRGPAAICGPCNGSGASVANWSMRIGLRLAGSMATSVAVLPEIRPSSSWSIWRSRPEGRPFLDRRP